MLIKQKQKPESGQMLSELASWPPHVSGNE